MHTTTAANTPDTDPIREITAAIALGKTFADQARADLETAVPELIAAIQHHSGQSQKIENLLWSCWNDEHQVNLCDSLSGLDARLAKAAIAMIAGRAHLGGDADDMLRKIIDESGSCPPPTKVP
jgi:hypothetical protein